MARSCQGLAGQVKAFGVMEIDVEKRFFCGWKVFLSAGRLWFFHSFGNQLMPEWMPGAANWGTYSCCSQLSWKRAVGTWGRSAGARVTEQLGRRCWVAVGVLLSPTLHGSRVELPTGSHTVPHWRMAAGI